MRYLQPFVVAVVLASLESSLAQVQTVTIFEPTSFAPITSAVLAGEVIGVGSEGTTLVVSLLSQPTPSAGGTEPVTEEVPFTETVVENSSHISAGASERFGIQTAIVDLQCGLASSESGATCTAIEVVEGENFNGTTTQLSTLTATLTITGTLFALPVAVSTAPSVTATAADTSGSASLSSTATSTASTATTSSSVGATTRSDSLSVISAMLVSLVAVAAFLVV